jgi:hypothetical protein
MAASWIIAKLDIEAFLSTWFSGVMEALGTICANSATGDGHPSWRQEPHLDAFPVLQMFV